MKTNFVGKSVLKLLCGREFCWEKRFKTSVWKTEIMEYKSKMKLGKEMRKRNTLTFWSRDFTYKF